MATLYETARPEDWPEVVGQDKAVKTCQLQETRGLAGRAVALTGPTGSGKTTIARILAKHFADTIATMEFDATGLAVSDIEEIVRKVSAPVLFGGGWAVIVNEIHGLSKASLRRLLTALEDRAATRHCLWLFTTTNSGLVAMGKKAEKEKSKDFAAFFGRCNHVPLAERVGAEVIAARIQAVAQREGLDGKPLAQYVRFVRDNRNSWRACYSQIECGAMMGAE